MYLLAACYTRTLSSQQLLPVDKRHPWFPSGQSEVGRKTSTSKDGHVIWSLARISVFYIFFGDDINNVFYMILYVILYLCIIYTYILIYLIVWRNGLLWSSRIGDPVRPSGLGFFFFQDPGKEWKCPPSEVGKWSSPWVGNQTSLVIFPSSQKPESYGKWPENSGFVTWK